MASEVWDLLVIMMKGGILQYLVPCSVASVMSNSLRSHVHGIFQARILEWVAMPSSTEANLCLLCLLHCKQILYPLSHQGSPFVYEVPLQK